jgi:uncharacterized protein YcnI
MSRRARTTLGVLALAALWLLGLHVGGLDTGVLFLAPAFVLALVLLADRYPGERLLTRFMPRHRRAQRRSPEPPCTASSIAPRGGLLLASALAKRGPPDRQPAVLPDGRSRHVHPHFEHHGGAVPDHRRITFAAVAAAALVVPAAAQAHVTVQPTSAPAGAFTEEVVRVPNESDTASTTKVDLQLPPGFVSASYEPAPGWTVKVTKQKLAKPVQTDDGPVTEEVRRITWTGDGSAQGKIAPGQFMDFPLSVQIPDKAGTKLTFKALQTYDDGKVVRWIGAPGSDEPAPQVAVTAAAAEHAAAPAATAQGRPTAAKSDSSGGSDTLSIVALVVGALGLLAGGVALLTTRRRATTTV